MGDPVQEVFDSPADTAVSNGSVAPEIKKSKPSRIAEKLDAILFHQPERRDLRRLAAVRRVLIHYTSVDPLGDYVAGDIEILDDRIKRDSFASVVGALVAKAQGAPLKAISRALGGSQNAFLYQVSDYVERAAHGIYGEVAGTEVTIGDEELLLERGVILDSLADSLLEEGQEGFYLLIAVGDSIIARCLITPPRVGDGRALLSFCRERGISVEVFSLGTSGEAQQCAQDLGLTGEQVRAIETSLHLDALLDQPESFIVLTSDPDCAEYVGSKGLVAYFCETDRGIHGSGRFCMRSFDLRGMSRLLELSRKQVRAEKFRWGAIALAALTCAVGAAAFLL